MSVLNRKFYFLFFLYFIGIVFFSVFSYSLTDPNLVLINNSIYWRFQQFMWQTFFVNSQLQTSIFIGLFIYLFSCYLFLLKYLIKLSFKEHILLCIIVSVPLLFSYNALSHDVFNYIFNAKMVAVYHTNPHTHVALDFPHDEWIRFMHNTHTAAPYGYVWTLISLLPFLLGSGKFILTFFSF